MTSPSCSGLRLVPAKEGRCCWSPSQGTTSSYHTLRSHRRLVLVLLLPEYRKPLEQCSRHRQRSQISTVGLGRQPRILLHCPNMSVCQRAGSSPTPLRGVSLSIECLQRPSERHAACSCRRHASVRVITCAVGSLWWGHRSGHRWPVDGAWLVPGRRRWLWSGRSSFVYAIWALISSAAVCWRANSMGPNLFTYLQIIQTYLRLFW